MGSHVPLGYERDERTLRINEAEVETVRTLYTLYRKPETTPSFPENVLVESDCFGSAGT